MPNARRGHSSRFLRMSLSQFIAAALVLGALHSFGPDHLGGGERVRQPAPGLAPRGRPRRALGAGPLGVAILLLGGAVVLSGVRLPERVRRSRGARDRRRA